MVSSVCKICRLLPQGTCACAALLISSATSQSQLMQRCKSFAWVETAKLLLAQPGALQEAAGHCRASSGARRSRSKGQWWPSDLPSSPPLLLRRSSSDLWHGTTSPIPTVLARLITSSHPVGIPSRSSASSLDLLIRPVGRNPSSLCAVATALLCFLSTVTRLAGLGQGQG